MLTTKTKIALASLAYRCVAVARAVAGKDNSVVVNRGGLRWSLDLAEGIDFSIYLLGAFEPSTAATIQKLVKPGDGGVLAAILPAGMRAISTRIKEETGVGRLILPNDHVDVILTQRRRGRAGGDEFVSDTLFRNVRVLAIGQLIEAKDGKKLAEGNTATLELTPRQSENLALANSMGEISLALRSIADIDNKDQQAAGPDKRGNSIRVLRYGVKSRAYGVN